MTRAVITALLVLALSGCADVRFYAAGYAKQIIHPDNPMVLTIRITSACGQVVEWVRLADADKVGAVCDRNCNCKLVKIRKSHGTRTRHLPVTSNERSLMSIRTFVRKLDREIVAELPPKGGAKAYWIRRKTDQAFRRAEERREVATGIYELAASQEGALA